jgi:hypothetical protein
MDYKEKLLTTLNEEEKTLLKMCYKIYGDRNYQGTPHVIRLKNKVGEYAVVVQYILDNGNYQNYPITSHAYRSYEQLFSVIKDMLSIFK